MCECGLGLREEEMGMEEWTLGLREEGPGCESGG